MEIITKKKYNGEFLTVITDEQGLFALSTKSMKALANALMYTCTKINDEDIELKNRKDLLACYPDMFPQIYGEDDPIWIEYEANKPPKIKEKKQTPSGYIYVIKAVEHDYYKIGVSGNVPKRVKDLDRQYPFSIEIHTYFKSNDVFKDEKKLHAEFESKKYKGEWFNLDEHDLEKIEKYKG